MQHHERRQTLILAAEPIVDPRAHARASRELIAGLEQRDGRIVIDRLGMHAAQDAKLIGDLGGIRQAIAQPLPALAVLLEFVHRGSDRKAILIGDHASDALASKDRRGDVLIETIPDEGLVVEQVDLRGSAGLKKKNDALGARLVIGKRRGCCPRLG